MNRRSILCPRCSAGGPGSPGAGGFPAPGPAKRFLRSRGFIWGRRLFLLVLFPTFYFRGWAFGAFVSLIGWLKANILFFSAVLAAIEVAVIISIYTILFWVVFSRVRRVVEYGPLVQLWLYMFFQGCFFYILYSMLTKI